MSNATAADDFGAAMGMVLRSYAEMVGPQLVDFPQGARGYETLCEVLKGEPPSQAALAAKLGIDRTIMTYLLDDLAAAGLVERRPNPADRRQRRIVATPHGRAAVSELCGRVAEAEQAALARLDENERVLFRRLLSKAAGTAPAHTEEACAIVTGALAE
ncbi:MarR family winged helix-turn-helix transcriptional regulator [Actinoplanes sp. NPDC049265]|uniref:MarR family winged helix-turn-helix transcriptional regulator n=1 Tax=Actinoplanes sp. NPDC049265 TaxID=3363902 RepID=UPI00371048B9